MPTNKTPSELQQWQGGSSRWCLPACQGPHSARCRPCRLHDLCHLLPSPCEQCMYPSPFLNPFRAPSADLLLSNLPHPCVQHPLQRSPLYCLVD